jgi:NADH-quinone oxidoreductase subunit L
MGGLAPKLKITFATFAAGALALIGCPPFSGFFSKDAILALAYQHNTPIFIIGLTTAFLTAFYVSRAVVVVFLGKSRSDVARVGKESPRVMIIPLVVLALFALIAGWESVAQNFLVVPHEKETVFTVPALALAALILGVGIAVLIYRNRERDPLHVDLVRRRFYIDEFYEWLINRTQELLARVAAFFDRWIIDAGVVRGASGGTFGIGALLRLFQVGNLQAYAFLFGLGIVALIYFTIFR